MGIVKDYDEFSLKYLVQYPGTYVFSFQLIVSEYVKFVLVHKLTNQTMLSTEDQTNEWTNISRKPMSSYLSCWRSKYKDNTKNKPTQLNSKQNVDSSRIRSRHKRQFSPDMGNGNYERQEEFQYVCSPSDFSSDIELCNTDGSDKSSTLICIDDIELGKRVCEKSDNPSLKEKSRLVSPAIAKKSDNRRMKRNIKQTWAKEVSSIDQHVHLLYLLLNALFPLL